MNIEETETIAREMMDDHGLRDWELRIGKAKTFFGVCNLGKKRVTLSGPLIELNDWPKIKDTILHEIAHALAPVGEHHGPVWKKIAASIGCSAERCYGSDVETPEYRYRVECGTCGMERRGRHRRPHRGLVSGCCHGPLIVTEREQG